MYTLRFDETDLAYNRRGSLSEAQRQRVELNAATMRVQARQALRWLGGFVALLLVVGIAIELSHADWDPARLSSSSRLGLAIASGGLAMIFAIAAASSAWTTRRYHRGAIRSVDGVAHVVDRVVWLRGPTPIHNLELRRGDLRKFTFRFQDAGSLGYFRDGARYRVYYLRATIPLALSAEQIEG